MLTEEQAKAVMKWQRSHRRDRATADTSLVAVTGFGMPSALPGDGPMTLWLPAGGSARGEWIIRDGRPVFTTSDPYPPHIAELRDAVILGARRAGPGLLRVPLDFISFTLALLGEVYAFSDDELTQLLRGSKWHAGVAELLIFSDGAEAALVRALPLFASEPEPAPLPPRVPDRLDSPAWQPPTTTRRSWWSTFLPAWRSSSRS